MKQIQQAVRGLLKKAKNLITLPFIGSPSFGVPNQEELMFVEVVPREVTDIVRKTLNNITNRGGLIDDALGYETLHHAVIEAENVGASLTAYVKAENLLFIFGQTFQSLAYTPIKGPMPEKVFGASDAIGQNRYKKYTTDHDKNQAQNRAVVLCKLKHADELELFLVGKEKKGGYGTKTYQITWGELQDLKKRLCGSFGKHKTPN